MTELEQIGRWLGVLLVLGWLAMPVTRRLLPGLPDGAVCLARPLAVLLVGYAAWLAASLRLLPFGLAVWLVGLPLLALLSIGTVLWGVRRRDSAPADQGQAIAPLSTQHSALSTPPVNFPFTLAHEALFVAVFLAFAWLRGYLPDITFTEKPMELMLLNSALHATTMPPADGWLAGQTVNYYYLGYVLAAALAHLSAAPVGYAFNLMLTTVVALAASTVFGLAAGQWALHRDEARPRLGPAAGAVGLLAAYLLVAAGNLVAGWRWLREPAETMADSWWAGIGWGLSRVLVDRLPSGSDWPNITEFPWFSFVLGDLHPHVLALPFGLLALGVALDWWRDSPAAGLLRRDRLAIARLLGGALCVGALYAINSWDFPLALLLTGLSLTRPAWWRFWTEGQRGRGAEAQKDGGERESAGESEAEELAQGPGVRSDDEPQAHPVSPSPRYPSSSAPLLLRSSAPHLPISHAVVAGAVLVGVSLLLVSPFLLSFASFAGNNGVRLQPPADRLPLVGSLARLVGVVTWARTDLGEFLQIWGCLAAGGAAWVLALARRGLRLAPQIVGLGVIGVALVGVLLGSAPTALAGGLLLAALLVWRYGRVGQAEGFVVLLLAAGLALMVAAEFVFLQDVFANRMNTLFKAYYQAWMVLSIVAALGVGAMVRALGGVRAKTVGMGEVVATSAGAGVLAMALLLTLGYPLIATGQKIDGAPRRGLDGLAYIAQRPDEAAALTWLAQHVPPGTVVAEDPGHSYGEYFGLPHARAATVAGTLAPLGWPGHQQQWRANQPALLAETNARLRDMQDLYGSTDPAAAARILDRYGVQYVYVGIWERDADARQRARQPVYSPAALAKFEGFMDVAFRQGQVTIFQRRA